MKITILQCDVCEETVKDFHNFAGNVADFGVSEVCDFCWEELDNSVADLREKTEDFKHKLIEKILAKTKKDKTGLPQ